MPEGIWLFANGVPANSVRAARERVVDGLLRAGVVRRSAEVAPAERFVRHVEERREAARPLVALERPEEEELFLLMGPPTVPPNVFASTGSLSGLAPRRRSTTFAFNLSLLKNSNAEPLNWFVPDLVTTVTAAPPAIPCSASKLLVEMLTVSIVSAGEMYMLWFGSQMFTFVAPSVRVELFVFA